MLVDLFVTTTGSVLDLTHVNVTLVIKELYVLNTRALKSMSKLANDRVCNQQTKICLVFIQSKHIYQNPFQVQ